MEIQHQCGSLGSPLSLILSSISLSLSVFPLCLCKRILVPLNIGSSLETCICSHQRTFVLPPLHACYLSYLYVNAACIMVVNGSSVCWLFSCIIVSETGVTNITFWGNIDSLTPGLYQSPRMVLI